MHFSCTAILSFAQGLSLMALQIVFFLALLGIIGAGTCR